MPTTVDGRPESLRASITLPAAPASAAEARHWLSALVAGYMPADQADAAVLCVSELVANVAQHAHSDGMQLSVAGPADDFYIEVSDNDPFMGPRSQTASFDDESGRGLGIIDALASDWGVRKVPDDGKAIWVRLN